MILNKRFCGYWVLFLSASFFLLNGCQGAGVASKWLDKDIVIDARDNEWQDCIQYSRDGSTIGIYNDESYVYMCFTTTNEHIQTELTRQGFIVWFNQAGSKKKELGIRYPVIDKSTPGGPPGGQGKPGSQGAPPGGEVQVAPPVGQGGPDANVNQVSVKEIKILTSEKDAGKDLTLDEAAELDIYASIKNDQSGKLIYELKMPLKKTGKTPYAAVPSAANNIGIGFMLYSAPGSGMPGGGFESGMNGGMGGGGGNNEKGGGGLGGGSAMEKTKLEVWTSVTLASKY
jgi:hypothetical protein